MVIKAFGIIIAFPSITILLTNSAPSLRILGTLNGFATTFSGIGRAAGPALTGITFSWGAENGYIVAPFAFLAFFAALGAIPVFMLEEGEGPTATPELSDNEEDATIAGESAILTDEEDEPSSDSPLLGRSTQTHTTVYDTIRSSSRK